jgi:hypothetical protein
MAKNALENAEAVHNLLRRFEDFIEEKALRAEFERTLDEEELEHYRNTFDHVGEPPSDLADAWGEDYDDYEDEEEAGGLPDGFRYDDED